MKYFNKILFLTFLKIKINCMHYLREEHCHNTCAIHGSHIFKYSVSCEKTAPESDSGEFNLVMNRCNHLGEYRIRVLISFTVLRASLIQCKFFAAS